MPKLRPALKRRHLELIARLLLALAILPSFSLPAHSQQAADDVKPSIQAAKVSASTIHLISPNSVTTDTTYSLYLPLIVLEQIPFVPILNAIDNSDQDNHFSVSWAAAQFADQYVLQESLDPSFAAPQTVYQGPDFSWSVPAPGKTPATYYYRLRADNSWGQSGWSNIPVVTIHPQFVGLALHWDGAGYIRGSTIYDVGSHETLTLDMLTDADTIRISGQQSYDPNPQGWPASSWYWYYSVVTGQFKSSSVPDDPSWKWGDGWRLAYGAHFTNGQTSTINGQHFTVTGPHQGTTAFGTVTTYWEFVNQNDFLYWDGGGAWTERVHPGDIVLRYEAGNLGYELYSSILRRYYYQGNATSDTVQYITNLTSCNICQGTTVSAGTGAAVGSRTYVSQGLGVPERASPPRGSTRGPIHP